jgi:hypothetical protein
MKGRKVKNVGQTLFHISLFKPGISAGADLADG